MQAFPYDLFPRNCFVLVLAAQRLLHRLEQTSAQRLFLIINLVYLNEGPLPGASPDGVQVKLVSVLPLIKGSRVFYLETGGCHAFCACWEMSQLLLVWLNGQKGTPVPSCLSPEMLCQWAWAWLSTGRHLQVFPGSASGKCLWTLAETPFSPAAQVSDGLGVGKGSSMEAQESHLGALSKVILDNLSPESTILRTMFLLSPDFLHVVCCWH